MTTPIGRSKWELDTPALCVELTTLGRNVERMAGTFKRHGVGWRPHTKGQKVPAVAHMELAAGAFGVTCAKLSEAEVMAASGIRDILVANQVVGPEKVVRLVNLQRHADVMVAVDSPDNAGPISDAARAKGVRVRALIEVDTGMHRAGTQPGGPTVELAKRVADMPGIRLAGVMGWEGHAIGERDPDQKRAMIHEAVGQLVETAQMCRAAGIPAEIVSCGGTGTYWITATVPGVTEVQAGGGIFHDLTYRDGMGLVDHEFAMTIITSVTSRPNATRIICDAGKKAMSSDSKMPQPLIDAKLGRIGLSAEHARIELEEPNDAIKVGDKIEWVVGYSDTTTFLHDEMYATRNGIVEQVWQVLGRGKLR